MKQLLTTLAIVALLAPVATQAESIDVSADKVVYNLPAGAELKSYLRNGEEFYQWGSDDVRHDIMTATLCDVAEYDGKIYISNSIADGTKGYLVGTRTGNTVTFTFPQVLEYSGDYVAVMRLDAYSYIDDTWGYPYTINTYVLSDKEQKVVFNYEDGNLIQADDVEFGLVKADGTWDELGETAVKYTLFTEELVVVPDDAERFEVAIKYQDTSYRSGSTELYKIVKGAKSGNEIFLQGLSAMYPESWVKGTIDGDKITFKGGQFLGIDSDYIQYFCTALDDRQFMPGYNTWMHDFTIIPEIIMNFDAQSNEMWADDINESFIISPSPTVYDFAWEVYFDLTLKRQPANIDPHPLKPLFTKGVNQWTQKYSDKTMLYPFLTFQLLPLNIYGDVLDKANLGFEIEVDGEPYTFTASRYRIGEDKVIIPFRFFSAYINMLDNGWTTVEFSGEDSMSGVTIRAVYKVGDQLYYSEPQNPLDPENQEIITEVEEIICSPIASSSYYDLKGNVVVNPAKGIYILRNQHEDGSITYSKVAF
ncbi:MAG: hypothetical protein K2H96_06140 [Muribaculaceae bacterium]|nr:hypothetical protein [Muribaculaceae bacterium]